MTKAGHRFRLLITLALLCGALAAAQAENSGLQVVICVPDQTLLVFENGAPIARYPVSTSKYGVGDQLGSYRTPLGQLVVKTKIGEGLRPGAVLKRRCATGEVLKPNAPGRDPIVTRIIWLEGLETQNRNAYERGIYIHGTPEEKRLGTPVSWGCIRMASRDVAALYDQLSVGTPVLITSKRVSEMRNLPMPEIPSRQFEPAPATPAPAPETPVRFAWGTSPRQEAQPARGFPVAFNFRDLRCTGVLAYRATAAAENATLDPNLIRLASRD